MIEQYLKRVEGVRPGREAPAESGAEPAGGLEDSLKGAAAPGGSRGLPARRPEGRRGRLRGGRIARGQLHADIAMSVGNEDEVAAPTSSLARRARQAGQAARFPQGEKNKIVRQHWIANLERKDFNRGSSSRVCSVHFIDGRPTKDNPYPTLHLGTPTVHHNGIRKLACHDVTPLEPDACSTAEPLSHHSSDEQDKESASADHHLPINVGTEDLSHRREGAQDLVDGCLACGCRCKIAETSDKGTQVEPATVRDHLYATPRKQAPVTADSACQTIFSAYSALAPSHFRFFYRCVKSSI
ncbi:uncharacterized protein LOC144132262 [Amblyomma americanum]